MTEQYDQAIATHYSSYRPPLHQIILGKVLSDKDIFQNGLDVGCGTGYSAVALAHYCQHVYGIEPSQSMLDHATPHINITYLAGNGERIPIVDHSIDIVTFAGSLFYTKTHALVTELKRVCQSEALIIPYDFDVLLDDVLRSFGMTSRKNTSDYDPTVNFSDNADFVEVTVDTQQLNLEVSALQLTHLLLSNKHRYEAFANKYTIANPFPAVVDELEQSQAPLSLKTNIFFSKYQLNIE